MLNRSAHSSLLGYHYQFDKSILELVELPHSGTATIEGIEDIDLSTPRVTCIQCKYLGGQKFTPSLLRKPLQAMLLDHRDSTSTKSYVLYAHFKDTPSFRPLDVERLKHILTYKVKGAIYHFFIEQNLCDKTLDHFLQKFTFRLGPSFESQRETLLLSLAKTFKCTKEVVESFYYPRALAGIVTLATRPHKADRTVGRDQFFSDVGDRTVLFSHWLCALLGKDKAIKYHKNALRRTSALRPQNRKLLVLYSATIRRDSSYTLVALIQALTYDGYRLGHALWDATPWTVAVDLDRDSLNDLKRDLLRNGIAYNDGYEDLGFFPSHFNNPPVINRKTTAKGKATEKIGLSSYSLRLLSTETLASNATSVEADVLLTTSGSLHGFSAQHIVILGDEYTLEDLAYVLS